MRELFESRVKDRAVLIGGTFGSVDIHESPRGPMPGLRINAYAVEAQIQSPAFYAVNQPLALLLDVLLALIFVFVELRIEHWHGKLPGWLPKNDLVLFGSFVSCGIVLLAAALMMFWKWQYVPALVGVWLGVLLHQFVHAHIHERHVANPRHTHRSSRRAPRRE
jgi:CHASE2 domain-containing sensor protein